MLLLNLPTCEAAQPGALAPPDPRDGIRVKPLTYIDTVKMDMATNGDIFVAVGLDYGATTDEYIELYESVDGGTTFTLWGTLHSTGDDGERLQDLDVVNGTPNRVFVT